MNNFPFRPAKIRFLGKITNVLPKKWLDKKERETVEKLRYGGVISFFPVAIK
jgi:hypothetical protein